MCLNITTFHFFYDNQMCLPCRTWLWLNWRIQTVVKRKSLRHHHHHHQRKTAQRTRCKLSLQRHSNFQVTERERPTSRWWGKRASERTHTANWSSGRALDSLQAISVPIKEMYNPSKFAVVWNEHRPVIWFPAELADWHFMFFGDIFFLSKRWLKE